MERRLLSLVLVLYVVNQVHGNNPTVRITSTDPQVKTVGGDIVQQRGKDIQLTCVVEDKPVDPKVQWTVFNRAVNSSTVLIASATKTEDAFRWSIDRPSATSWRLRIQNAQEVDEGVYTCKVEVASHNNVLDSRKVRIVEKPQIRDLETSTDMIKTTGESATLECMATGRPTPTIRWTRMAGELLPNGGSVLQANNLYIRSVAAGDAGYYKCSASNMAGTDERLILFTVKFKPIITASDSIVKQKVGYVKQLVCNIKGYPLPTSEQIGWTKDNRPVNFDRRVQIRNIVGAYNRITSIIDIRGVRENDFGMYRCAASNERGNNAQEVQLEPSPVPTADRSHRIVSAGVPVLLMNIGLTVTMVLITCLCQRMRNLH